MSLIFSTFLESTTPSASSVPDETTTETSTIAGKSYNTNISEN